MLIIGIKSCQLARNLGCHQDIRDTWGKTIDSRAELRFFFGGEPVSDLQPDEVQLPCPDDYDNLPFKTKSICRWNRTDNPMYLCDNDTYVRVERLLESRYDEFDYTGYFNWPGGVQKEEPFRYLASNKGKKEQHYYCYAWASGGVGYTLSKQAQKVIAANTPDTYAEDLWVGKTLGPHIKSGALTRYINPHFHGHVAWHYPEHKNGLTHYDPKNGWMQMMMKRYP